MAETRKNPQVSALYLKLAAECFTKAEAAMDAGAAETLRRMGSSYFSQAVALNPLLSNEHFEHPRRTPSNVGGQ